MRLKTGFLSKPVNFSSLHCLSMSFKRGLRGQSYCIFIKGLLAGMGGCEQENQAQAGVCGDCLGAGQALRVAQFTL